MLVKWSLWAKCQYLTEETAKSLALQLPQACASNFRLSRVRPLSPTPVGPKLQGSCGQLGHWSMMPLLPFFGIFAKRNFLMPLSSLLSSLCGTFSFFWPLSTFYPMLFRTFIDIPRLFHRFWKDPRIKTHTIHTVMTNLFHLTHFLVRLSLLEGPLQQCPRQAISQRAFFFPHFVTKRSFWRDFPFSLILPV